LTDIKTIIIGDEKELIDATENLSAGIILLKRPIPAYKILREKSLVWQHFHVHAYSAHIDDDLLTAVRILLQERLKLGDPPSRISRGKAVSRREVFSLWRSLKEYINGPIPGPDLHLLNSDARRLFSKICPYGALLEDLVSMVESRCNECGICYSFLPVQVLENFLLPFDGIKSLLALLSSRPISTVVLYYALSIEEKAYNVISKWSNNVLGIPVTNSMVPWWLPLLHKLYGVPAILLGPPNPYLSYIQEDIKNLYLNNVFHAIPNEEVDDEFINETLKTKKKANQTNIDSKNLVPQLSMLLQAEGKGLSSYKPDSIRSFVPIVENQKCIFCGACVKSCPYEALELESEPKLPRLLLKLNYCQGCYNCMYACPTQAISRFEPLLTYNGYKTVAHDEMINCIYCGSPVGSRRRIEYIEKKMIESGMDSEKVVQITRVCPVCRTKNLVKS
jgi:ferredoxin